MKFLVVALVVAVVVWMLLRGSGERRKPRSRSTPEPQTMVRCLHCGVHLPRGEAIEDARGTYCSEAHRLAATRSS